MGKFGLILGAVALVFGLSARTAAAATVHCPVADIGNNDYFATGAVDCVYDGNKDNQNQIGNGGTDEFIAGEGVNEAAYGNSGPTFGLSWTLVCDTGGLSNSCTGSGLSLTSLQSQSTNYTVTNVAYANYAIGIKDGDHPFWAVFLLDAGKTGQLSMTGGGFSHFVLYGAGTPTTTNQDLTPVPEPASLLLLSSGLALAGNRLRKRRKQQTAA